MSPTPDAEPQGRQDLDLERKLERLGELVRRMIASVRFVEDSTDLTPTQLVVLSILEQGPIRVGMLAVAMGAAQNTVSEVVARLQRSGLVSKQRDPADNRAVLVQLTDRGVRALEARRTAMRATHRAVLEALTKEDRQRFVDAFELIVEMTERARDTVTQSREQARRSR